MFEGCSRFSRRRCTSGLLSVTVDVTSSYEELVRDTTAGYPVVLLMMLRNIVAVAVPTVALLEPPYRPVAGAIAAWHGTYIRPRVLRPGTAVRKLTTHAASTACPFVAFVPTLALWGASAWKSAAVLVLV